MCVCMFVGGREKIGIICKYNFNYRERESRNAELRVRSCECVLKGLDHSHAESGRYAKLCIHVSLILQVNKKFHKFERVYRDCIKRTRDKTRIHCIPHDAPGT